MKRSLSNNILGIMEDLKKDPWFKKIFPTLSPNQFMFVLDYLEENKNLPYHEFHKNLNRLFITSSSTMILNKVSYSYQEIFPKGKKITSAQELIGMAFDLYYENNGNTIWPTRDEMIRKLKKEKSDIEIKFLLELSSDDLLELYKKHIGKV